MRMQRMGSDIHNIFTVAWCSIRFRMDFGIPLRSISVILVFLVHVDIASGVDCNQILKCFMTFRDNYPPEDRTNLLLSVPDELEYICITHRSTLECVDKGLDSCPNVQSAIAEAGVKATQYRQFLRNKCPSYNSVFQNKTSCVKDALQSPDYLPCTYKISQKYPIPQDRNVRSCPLYYGILRCVDLAVEKCGCAARDYLKDGIQLRWTLPTSTCTNEPKCSGAAVVTTSAVTFTVAALVYIKSIVVNV